MNQHLKQMFLERWEKYFPGAELPITFFYTDDESLAERPISDSARHCLIGDLGAVRKGHSMLFALDDIACSGGKRYTGMSQSLRPNFSYFLSCGIPGKLEGERYKKTPEIVEQMGMLHQAFEAPGKFILFKRFDKLTETDAPLAAIFFATPDILAGLFTLVNYEESIPDGVMAPMCAGCSSIIYYPYMQLRVEQQRAVLGMFDVSARPYVPAGTLTLAVPWPKFERMVVDMDESFLITESWHKVQRRINRDRQNELNVG